MGSHFGVHRGSPVTATYPICPRQGVQCTNLSWRSNPRRESAADRYTILVRRVPQSAANCLDFQILMLTLACRARPLLVVGAIVALMPFFASCSFAPSSHASAPEKQLTTTSSSPPISRSTTASTGSTHATPTTTTVSAPTQGGAIPPGQPLATKIVGIDPGHNGLNYTDPTYLNQQIFNGRTEENCDTTGTETASGYTEAQFNFNVAQFLATDLETEGAQVVLTRSSNAGIGPCVDQRAQIINDGHADVAIDIHADGGPVSGRGFAILEPVADGPNDSVINSSEAFGADVRASFLATTGMPLSTYDGTDGITSRDDLAGLNLTAVPKVLIECGNMQNATDAALLTSSSFQQKAALALALAITNFLS
jgi:N-acetylmuramoyl-L-alanine amidase